MTTTGKQRTSVINAVTTTTTTTTTTAAAAAAAAAKLCLCYVSTLPDIAQKTKTYVVFLSIV